MFEELSLTALATFCRSLSTMLESGVNVVKAFQVAGGKSHNARLRQISADIVDQLRKGSEVSEAMAAQGKAFPELTIDLVRVADQTGSLPEVLKGLAEHYENLIRLRRTFIGAIAMPVIQLLAAIFIVAGLIVLLDMIASSQGGKAVDILGLGLRGSTGALTWLGGWFALAGIGTVGYLMLAKNLKGKAVVHQALLKIPVLGGCLRSFALARFSWAFALTQQAGMSITPSLESSLKATGNGAYAAVTPQVVAMIMAGEDLSFALQETGLFNREYLELVRVGETSGTVPETLERLSPQLEEQARRSLSALTTALGWAIWAMVATIIILVIFKIVLTTYIRPMNEILNNPF
jgi:type IV pilus assembly protein PilC